MDELLHLFKTDKNAFERLTNICDRGTKEIDNLIDKMDNSVLRTILDKDEPDDANVKDVTKRMILDMLNNNGVTLFVFKQVQKKYEELLKCGILWFHDELTNIDDIYLSRYTDNKMSNFISKTDYINYKYSNLDYYCNYVNSIDYKIQCSDIDCSKITHNTLIDNYYTKILKNSNFIESILKRDNYYMGASFHYGTDLVNVRRNLSPPMNHSLLKVITKDMISIMLNELQEEFNIMNNVLSKLLNEYANEFKRYNKLLSIYRLHFTEGGQNVTDDEILESFNEDYEKIYKIPSSVISKYQKLNEAIDKNDKKKRPKKTLEMNSDLEKIYIGIGLWYNAYNHILIYTLTHIVPVKDVPYDKMIDNYYLIEPFLLQTQHPNYNTLISCYNSVKDHLFIPIFSVVPTKQFNKIKKSLAPQNSYYEILTAHKNHISFEEELLLDDIREHIKKKRKQKKKKKTFKNKVIELDATNMNDIIEAFTDSNSNSDEEAEEADEADELEEIKAELEKIQNNTEEQEDKSALTTKQNHFIINFNYYEFFEDKNYIRFLINDCYINNEKFYNFMSDYTHIQVKKDIHTDRNRMEKSLHFNLVFFNADFKEISKQYHAYIFNNSISSITRIESIL